MVWMAALMATIVVASAFPAFAERPTPPAAPYPNMGYCAPILGQLQVRDDINRAINSGKIPGLDNAGDLYSLRARDYEDYLCLRRDQ